MFYWASGLKCSVNVQIPADCGLQRATFGAWYAQVLGLDSYAAVQAKHLGSQARWVCVGARYTALAISCH
jgi:hypothetical protein